MKNNFKVGQRYRVAIDGIKESGNIIEITNISKYFYDEIISYKTIKGEKGINRYFEKQSVFAKSLKLIDENQSIHIYQKGDEVHAILKKGKETVKTSVAKCSKDDEFDFETGVKIALNRIYGKKYTLDDFVKGGIAVKFKDKNEQIKFLTACQKRGLKWLDGEKPLDFILEDIERYIIYKYSSLMHGSLKLDEYKQLYFKDFDQSEFEDVYNAKLVCIHAGSRLFTKGRIYEVKNGFFKDNEGKKYGHAIDLPYSNIDQINIEICSKFIELVE